MRRSTFILLTGILTGGVFISLGCDGFQGRAFVRNPDYGIGPVIPGVEITFIKEDGSVEKKVVTDASGHYRITLGVGRYWALATHGDYEDYSSVPGFFVVTGDGYQTGNFFLREPRATTLLIVRHAEKGAPQYPDETTPLSPEGEARAEELAHVALNAGVTAVYATNYVRTKKTVEPLAELLRLDTNEYVGTGDLVGMVEADHEGDVVLVAGHSPSVVPIAQAFGADVAGATLPDFDNLMVVTVYEAGEANAINLQYGEPSDNPDGPAVGCYEKTTCLLVRSAEGGSAGAARAEALVHVARKAGVTDIFATEDAAALEAVQPTADLLGLDVGLFDLDDVAQFDEQGLAEYAGHVVLVAAGEKDVVAAIIKKIGGYPYPAIFPDERDSLFFITILGPSAGEAISDARVVGLQYGLPSP